MVNGKSNPTRSFVAFEMLDLLRDAVGKREAGFREDGHRTSLRERWANMFNAKNGPKSLIVG